jgi:HK97 family phage portal protein
MNFFTRIFNPKSVTQTQAHTDTFNKQYAKLFDSTKYGDVSIADAHKIAPVFNCIKILATSVGKAKLKVKKKTRNGKEDAVDHYLYPILNQKPNPYQNPQIWKSTLTNNMFFQGNSYAHIVRNGYKVTGLNIIPSNYFTSAKVHHNDIFYYSEIDDKVVKGSDLLHFKLLSSDIFGMNPIESLRLSLNLNKKSMQVVDNYYSKNAASTKILEYAELGNTNAKRLDEAIKKFEEENAGVENSGNIIVLPPLMRLKEIALNPVDAAFLATTNTTEKQIASLFQVPLWMIGHDDKHFSSYSDSSLAFKTYTISPILSIIQEELSFKLLDSDDIKNGYSIEFEMESLMDYDPKSMAEAYKILKDCGAMTPNEIAGRFNLSGSDSEFGDCHYTQMQYIPLEKYEEMYEKLGKNNNIEKIKE